MLLAGIVLSAVAVPDQSLPLPREVVRAFYESANKGRAAEARDYFMPDAVKRIESTIGGPRGFEAFCQDQTERGTMIQLDILEERVDRQTAKVAIRLKFKEGGLALRTEYLENQDGRWRLALEPSTPTP